MLLSKVISTIAAWSGRWSEFGSLSIVNGHSTKQSHNHNTSRNKPEPGKRHCACCPFSFLVKLLVVKEPKTKRNEKESSSHVSVSLGVAAKWLLRGVCGKGRAKDGDDALQSIYIYMFYMGSGQIKLWRGNR